MVSLLADGRFHPGEELGEQLGVSRAAVWKQIQKLQEAGLDVQSVRGKGYRLGHPLEWLDRAAILEAMDPQAAAVLTQLDIVPVLSSTNDRALAQASQGMGSGYVCLAEQQLAGRGRRGRPWVSPFASNLYASVLWEFEQGVAQLEGLSLATGVVVAEALQALGVPDLSLKWPNDLLLAGAKLGGILLEITGDPAGPCQVVLGVGINHRLPPAAAGTIDQSWGRLQDVKPDLGRNLLAARVLSTLLNMLRRFAVAGFAGYQQRWQALDAFADTDVILSTGTEERRGVARGVDRTGGLLLETESGLAVIKGGEISLRSRP
ncbi:MAG: bifunctional biotin--[acetyl-CoA-carboxylase] synthetase/biotin operon repressor [Pseudomonadales bacterium]|nr:bifunctional biotin--[acetyl-CoA-carboxylase] synthetase/biotin operon repressor [Pseudomonadales bacterium]